MITLPESIQEIVGRKIARIFTSHPALDQIVFDLESSSTEPRTRFAYDISGQISSIWNHGEMVGYTVSEIRALDNEPSGLNKMAIFTDNGARFGVIYFLPVVGEDSFITEEGGSAWVPIDESEIDYSFDSGDALMSDSVISFSGTGSADFTLSLNTGDETQVRVTSQSWSTEAGGAEAEFSWADGAEVQTNSAADPDAAFEPSPLEMEMTVDDPIVFDLFLSEVSGEFEFLVEVYVEGEGEVDLVQESDDECSCLLLETSDEDSDTELVDVTLGRNPPFNTTIQYIVQEDDVIFVEYEDTNGPCPCDGDED